MNKLTIGNIRKFIFKLRYMGKGHDSIHKYYIVFRHDDKSGLGSYIITNLGQIKYAVDNGMIPVVDMQHFANVYLEESEYCRINAWDFYFDQEKVVGKGLMEVYKEGDYSLSDGRVKSPYPDDAMEFLTDDKARQYWHELFKRYIPLQNDISRSVDEFVSGKFIPIFEKGEKIAGVCLRGTDYVALKPKKHPIQPTTKEAIDKINELREKWGFDRIFLVTEDSTIQSAIIEEFGDRVIVPDSYKYDYSGNGYIGNVTADRDRDRYLHGKEYLVSLLILGKCQFFIAGRTSGTVLTHVMAEGFEEEYYFDLGRYS